MPPPTITMVWPIATMPVKEATMMSVLIWEGEAKPGE